MPRARSQPDPDISKSRVNGAGNVLAGRFDRYGMSRDEALAIINNWRSAHGWPLNAMAVTLRDRALRLDSEAIVAQRLKRISSIGTKLRHFPDMALTTMQDIGGCRAIVGRVEHVEQLHTVYQEALSKSPNRGPEFVKEFDYLTEPKDSGYRGVHLVYRYRSRSEKHSAWNGLRIEIQLRSRLQHAWATAVETVSTFTGQQLKSSIGEAVWKRFFALMGSAIALRENRPLVPGTPWNPRDLVGELREIDGKLGIEAVLNGWQQAVSMLDRPSFKRAKLFLMVLDVSERRIMVTPYHPKNQDQASRDYLEAEKAAESNPNLNAVLASAESIAALQQAFPNYYVDTTQFRRVVSEVLKNPEQLELGV